MIYSVCLNLTTPHQHTRSVPSASQFLVSHDVTVPNLGKYGIVSTRNKHIVTLKLSNDSTASTYFINICEQIFNLVYEGVVSKYSDFTYFSYNPRKMAL